MLGLNGNLLIGARAAEQLDRSGDVLWKQGSGADYIQQMSLFLRRNVLL